jgi:hypothetical protein
MQTNHLMGQGLYCKYSFTADTNNKYELIV